MTVSSFTSVSLEPPLILVCIDRSAGFLQEMGLGLPFAVNVLSEDQQSLAKRFSDRRENQRFSKVEWTVGWKELPVLDHTSALFYCAVREVVIAGDHAVLIADVHGVAKHQLRPLVWCERTYHCLPSDRV
jgi:flavin reductase (DIM6/NTAB) family NADH-FMN oxidoreductase RutF